LSLLGQSGNTLFKKNGATFFVIISKTIENWLCYAGNGVHFWLTFVLKWGILSFWMIIDIYR
jgi:hypothetical protein